MAVATSQQFVSPALARSTFVTSRAENASDWINKFLVTVHNSAYLETRPYYPQQSQHTHTKKQTDLSTFLLLSYYYMLLRKYVLSRTSCLL